MVRGRPREFSTDEALDKAMLVFWRRGYRGTSLDDLTDALGINRPSLYAAFGDKETLFLSVVEQYQKKMLLPSAKELFSCENLREGLGAFFDSLGSLLTGPETPPGCMIACLMSEECCESELLRSKLASIIETADKNFTALFKSHERELVPSLSAEVAAKLLFSLCQGLAIRARAGASKRSLTEIGNAFIAAILI
ncbi:MAG TPA: TetR/AcrR family transcriptional regulator [Drouetiella sp.]|jgi:TetR/AcrR family transcriptional regulator, copper-responsive repressor